MRGFKYTVSPCFSAIEKTVTLNVASLVTDEEEVAVAFFAYDEDEEEYAEDAALDVVAEIEESQVVIDVRSLDSGEYKVVVTVDEEEFDAVVELDFKTVNAAIDKANKAETNTAFWLALQNELFEDVAVEAYVAEYKEGFDTQFDTVAEVIAAVKEINEERDTEGEFGVLKEALLV